MKLAANQVEHSPLERDGHRQSQPTGLMRGRKHRLSEGEIPGHAGAGAPPFDSS